MSRESALRRLAAEPMIGLPAGEIMLAGAALMMAGGFAIIRRIVDIDV